MSLSLVFRGPARLEFDEAADWYEQRRAGLGPAFTRAIRKVLDTITANPYAYPEVFQEVRELLVTGYPYAVYYRIESDRIRVISVFHTSRDPSVWQSRV